MVYLFTSNFTKFIRKTMLKNVVILAAQTRLLPLWPIMTNWIMIAEAMAHPNMMNQ